MSDCIEWTGPRHYSGYGQGRIPGDRRPRRAHRLVWEQVNGPIPDGLYVLHRCDNPPCVNVDHLFLGTQLDNMRDAKAKGRGWHPRGELNPKTHLTESQVREIRELYAAGGISQITIGSKYGIRQTSVSAIVRGQTWRTVAR
jgi:hypothetical protein